MKTTATKPTSSRKPGSRLTFEERRAKQLAAGAATLAKAQTSTSRANAGLIIEGFLAHGIALDQIAPGENTFTYNAWLAQGRQVRRGSKGVKVITYATPQPSEEDGEAPRGKMLASATVFHISQTDPIEAKQ